MSEPDDLPTFCNYCDAPALYFCRECHSLVCGSDTCEGYHLAVHMEEALEA